MLDSFHVFVDDFTNPVDEATFHRIMVAIDRDWPYCILLEQLAGKDKTKFAICRACGGRIWRNPRPSDVVEARQIVDKVINQFESKVGFRLHKCDGLADDDGDVSKIVLYKHKPNIIQLPSPIEEMSYCG